LHNNVTRGIVPDNKKPQSRTAPRRGGRETGREHLAEIRIVTEVAGRVCAVPTAVGNDVSDGDDIVLVEAMKMEIPVPSSSKGRIREILVSVDDVVAEGQTVAILDV